MTLVIEKNNAPTRYAASIIASQLSSPLLLSLQRCEPDLLNFLRDDDEITIHQQKALIPIEMKIVTNFEDMSFVD
jgi:hypothetical protein